jgi:hypothetical protein
MEDPTAEPRATGALGVAFYQLSVPELSGSAFGKDSLLIDNNYGGLAFCQPLSLPPPAAPRMRHAVSGASVSSKSCAHTAPAARVVSKISPAQLLALDGVPSGSVDQCVQSLRTRRGVRLAEVRLAEERWEKARRAERNTDQLPPPATLGFRSAELKISQAELKISQVGSAQARTPGSHHLPLAPCTFFLLLNATITHSLFLNERGCAPLYSPDIYPYPSPYPRTRPRPNLDCTISACGDPTPDPVSRWRLRRRRCAWAPALSPRKPSPSPPPPPHRNSAAPTSTLAVLPPPHLARARCHETPRRITWLLPRGCRSGRALCRPRIMAVPRCSESCTRSPTMPARTAPDLPARAVVRAWIPRPFY